MPDRFRDRLYCFFEPDILTIQKWARSLCTCVNPRFVKFGRRPVFKRRKPPAPIPRAQPCCVGERELWRERARAKGLIPERARGVAPSTQSRTSRCRHETQNSLHREEAPSPAVTGFLDLPFELRESIYTCYLEAHGQERLPYWSLFAGPENDCFSKPIPPHEPAITRVSRSIRKEFLPLFYKTYRFPLVAHYTGNCTLRTVDWYHYMHHNPDGLRMMRHFEISVCLKGASRFYAFNDIRFHGGNAARFHVDLDAKSQSVNVYAVCNHDDVLEERKYRDREHQ